MLAYAAGPAAMDWLAVVFGFRERDRRVSAEGRLEHGEMQTDIDRHFERAKTGGAHILSKLEDTGNGKRYRAEDLEGHRWMFIQADER